MTSVGKPKDATLETVALLAECGLYTVVSTPAFSITVLTNLALVALEARLYDIMLMRNNLGDILRSLVTLIYLVCVCIGQRTHRVSFDTDVSTPAFSITVLTYLAMEAPEALLYGFIPIRNKLGDILKSLVT